jgi:transcriptional accessory protein Tex/SPT6
MEHLMNEERPYAALVRDAASNDTIVFLLKVASAKEAQQAVIAFYNQQGWPVQDIQSIKVLSMRKDERGPIFYVSHEKRHLEEQVRRLCEKLLEEADGADLIEERDHSYAFVQQFDIGARVIRERLPDERPTEQ